MGLAYEKDAKQLTEARRLIADCADIGIEARLLFGSHSVSYPHASIHG
jgi:hypothetical protein